MTQHFLHDADVHPEAISAEAAPCRNVCRLAPSNPARPAMRANDRAAFLGSIGVPNCVENTRSS